jgi:hypothetical protein
MIARSITIAALDFPGLLAKSGNMAGCLKNRFQHKHLPSSTIPLERFYDNRSTISYLKLLGSKCYVHIRQEGPSCGSKHLPGAGEAIIVRYTASAKVYRVFTVEDKYVFLLATGHSRK